MLTVEYRESLLARLSGLLYRLLVAFVGGVAQSGPLDQLALAVIVSPMEHSMAAAQKPSPMAAASRRRLCTGGCVWFLD